MREILFRGKRIDNGELVEGHYHYAHWYLPPSMKIVDTTHYILPIGHGDSHKVAIETVGQFTGLTDKNGKKIFEGDVIKFHKYRGEPDWVGTIRYEHCCYIATGRMPVANEKRKNEKPFYCPFEVGLSGIDKTTIEVIGNIHDNPELLGGAEDGNSERV